MSFIKQSRCFFCHWKALPEGSKKDVLFPAIQMRGVLFNMMTDPFTDTAAIFHRVKVTSVTEV